MTLAGCWVGRSARGALFGSFVIAARLCDGLFAAATLVEGMLARSASLPLRAIGFSRAIGLSRAIVTACPALLRERPVSGENHIRHTVNPPTMTMIVSAADRKRRRFFRLR